jgi:hypothetical protein
MSEDYADGLTPPPTVRAIRCSSMRRETPRVVETLTLNVTSASKDAQAKEISRATLYASRRRIHASSRHSDNVTLAPFFEIHAMKTLMSQQTQPEPYRQHAAHFRLHRNGRQL